MISGVPRLDDIQQRRRLVRLQTGLRARRRRTRVIGVRWAVAAVLMLLSVATATAMVSGGWRYVREKAQSLRQRSTVAPVAVAPVRRSRAPIAAPAAVAIPLAMAAPPADSPAVAESHFARPDNRRIAAPRPPREKAAVAVAAVEPAPTVLRPESELLLAAMKARQSGDLAGAEQLLARYRQQFPDGVLSEEALVLSIELAAQRHQPQAEPLAAAYLRRFPRGRFRDRVLRALAVMVPAP